MEVWVEQELGDEFPDQRLKARLGTLFEDLGQRVGETIPLACHDWAATKAAYRFFDNPRVDEGLILSGHFAATTTRFAATKGPVLVLHDTTEFSFERDTPEGIGTLSLIKGRHVRHTVCGLDFAASECDDSAVHGVIPRIERVAAWCPSTACSCQLETLLEPKRNAIRLSTGLATCRSRTLPPRTRAH